MVSTPHRFKKTQGQWRGVERVPQYIGTPFYLSVEYQAFMEEKGNSKKRGESQPKTQDKYSTML